MGEDWEGRSIKLFCPTVSGSKIVQIIVWGREKVDLGSIARAFCLDPSSVKLNGHFLSRGADFVASSVTWKSLINFFSARGFSAGASDSGPLLVQGKLSRTRTGSKRGYDLVDADEVLDKNGQSSMRNHKKPQLEYGSIVEEPDSDLHVQTAILNGPEKCLGLKRKLWFQDTVPLKRSSWSDDVSDFDLSVGNCSSSNETSGPCSFICKNMKRRRDDEMLDCHVDDKGENKMKEKVRVPCRWME